MVFEQAEQGACHDNVSRMNHISHMDTPESIPEWKTPDYINQILARDAVQLVMLHAQHSGGTTKQ